MNDTLSVLKDAVAEYEFSRKVRRALTSVRLIDESDDETFARVMCLAKKVICPGCRGYGRTMGTDRTCEDCQGSGELAVTPSSPTRP